MRKKFLLATSLVLSGTIILSGCSKDEPTTKQEKKSGNNIYDSRLGSATTEYVSRV